MKKLMIAFMIVVLMPQILVASTSVSFVERWGLGAAWEGTKRVAPILARTTGDVVGSKWWKVGFGWGSLALMAGCIGWETYKALGGDPASDIAAWLNKVGLRWEGNQGQKKSGSVYQPKAGSATAASVEAYKAWLKANYVPSSQSQLVYFYTSSALSLAAQQAADHTGEVWLTANVQPGATGFSCTGAYGRTSDWRTRSWCYSTTPADFETVDQWTNKTDTQMATEISTAWSNTTGDAIDKEAWVALESAVVVPAVNDDPYGLVMAGVNPVTSKTLRDTLTDAVETDINDDAQEDDTDESGTLKEILKAILALPKTIATAITNSITSLFGLSETVPSAVEESDSQETIVGQEAINTMKSNEQEVTTGFLDDLWESVNGVKSEIDLKMQALIDINGSCSVMSESVWGATVGIDFCSIDYSALRAIMLALAAICACMIVMGVL